ncbi:hypothetical protein BKA70DRAFT_608017 [Coprinopsis sp. MPI-PUGE-AT-0042]|nr:hypothetical protein BKA70DRAFT_608017 [Coprinopsis sp. MPI-PUGE-AT-0042]
MTWIDTLYSTLIHGDFNPTRYHAPLQLSVSKASLSPLSPAARRGASHLLPFSLRPQATIPFHTHHHSIVLLTAQKEPTCPSPSSPSPQSWVLSPSGSTSRIYSIMHNGQSRNHAWLIRVSSNGSPRGENAGDAPERVEVHRNGAVVHRYADRHL